MSWQGHLKKGDDPLWVAVLSFELQQNLDARRKHNQALRLARATAISRFRWVTARPIAEIKITIGLLGATLEKSCIKDFHHSVGLRLCTRNTVNLTYSPAGMGTEEPFPMECSAAIRSGTAVRLCW